MARIRVIGDNGNEQEVTVNDSEFGVYIDGELFFPAATQSIEVESNGKQEKTGTQCGDIRQQTTATEPYDVTVECIITKNEESDTNALTLSDVLGGIQEGDSISIESAFPVNKPLTVSNVLVRQETELISVNTRLTNGSATAFRCQLQFGEQNNQ